MKPTIGIIGNGVVGKAQARVWLGHAKILIHDTDAKRSVHSLPTVATSHFVLVCVPTNRVEGLLACDTSKVEHVIAELAALNYKGIVCIRSTVPVGFTARQARQYKDMKFVFFPEFLRESSPVMDALTPSRHVLGYPECDQSIVPIELADLLMDRFPGVPVLNMTSDEAELVKLALNAFWAVKVSVFNELRGISDKLGLDWEAIRRGMLTDGRITQDHTQVPGPDGKRGFGGKCLPKDLANLIHCAQGLGLPVPILEAVWLRNCSLDRPSVNPGGVA